MFKNLVRFSLLLIVILLLVTCGTVIKLYQETNTIYVTPQKELICIDKFREILREEANI